MGRITVKFKDDPKEYKRQHYQLNYEHISKSNKAWYEANKDRVHDNDKRVRDGIREAIFQKFGNKCYKCGFTDRRCLQIDHIYNNGSEHRKRKGCSCGSTRKYLREILYDETGAYQILCANCNLIKYWEEKKPKKTFRKPEVV